MATLIPHLVDNSKTTNGGLFPAPRPLNLAGMASNPEYAEIGDRLRRVREAFSDLNQRQWAEKHGFPVTRYNNWEKGVRRITLDDASRLADLYGLDLDFIYRGKLDGLSDSARNSL